MNKKCKKCNKVKNEEDFYIKKKNGYRDNICKICISEINRERYKKNKKR